METLFDFSYGFALLKKGKTIARKQWNGNVLLRAQFPDENSKMTRPYLYMVKTNINEDRIDHFPCDLSCESLFAEDWFLVEGEDTSTEAIA